MKKTIKDTNTIINNIIEGSLIEDNSIELLDESVGLEPNRVIIAVELDNVTDKFVTCDTTEYDDTTNKSNKVNVYKKGSTVQVDELHEIIIDGISESQYFYKTVNNGYISADTLVDI